MSTNMLYEVREVTTTVFGNVSTKLNQTQKVTIGFVPGSDEEEDNFRVGNACGRFGSDTLTITIIDPALFDKFRVGQRLDLLKALL
jgi:hypothetical protein